MQVYLAVSSKTLSSILVLFASKDSFDLCIIKRFFSPSFACAPTFTLMPSQQIAFKPQRFDKFTKQRGKFTLAPYSNAPISLKSSCIRLSSSCKVCTSRPMRSQRMLNFSSHEKYENHGVPTMSL